MKRFNDVNDAMRSLERSRKIINSLPEYDYIKYGRIFLWHLYNICEAALYVCCAHDASLSGTITFPSLRELPKFNKIPEMDIPRDVRNAAKTVDKYSKPDLENDIDPMELNDATEAIRIFFKWICENTRVDEIRHILENILELDILNRIFAL